MKTLRSHGRYPYWPITQAPPFRWPRGDGLAVYVALNLEHYAFGEGMLDELVPLGPQPDVLNFSWLEWGNRVGAWRLLELFQSLDMPLTVLVNAAVYQGAPGLVEAFRAAGCEIAAHGRTNAERQGDLPAEGEAALIAEATGEIARQEGAPPAGWLGPWISESEQTPDLLKEAGYRYVLDWCCDDRPIPLATRAGPLLAVPYPQEANDANAIVVRRMARGRLRRSRRRPVRRDAAAGAGSARLPRSSARCRCTPMSRGQAHRIRHLRRALTHIAAHRERIWMTRACDIADVAARGYGIA